MTKKRKRQLAAIMFTDIVGYSAMMNKDEQDGIKKASHYRKVLSKQVESHGGEIIQHYGDGSLSIFSSSVEAVNCAKNIQIEFSNQPQIPLRVGIHLGDIVLDGEEIYGDGVNIASRVESMGIPGSVLITERVMHDLKSHPNLKLASLGSFQFKNIATPLEVFALADENFPVPDKNNISGKLEPIQQPNIQKEALSTTSKSFRYLGVASIGIIILLLGWNLWKHFDNDPKPTTIHAKERINIAVLPFENLSNNPENVSICNGLMQEIIARISAVKDFRVIPRTSVIQVANNNLSIPEIAKELGVKYVLEGSLQSSNDQIRINANLIQANDNEVIWNQSFKGNYSQIFNFQTKIAQSVSSQLGVTLTPQQAEIISQRPTDNMLAYTTYLKGLEALNLHDELSKFRNFNISDLEKAKTYFFEVIKIDKNFAEAYIKLAEVYYRRDARKGMPLDSSIYCANQALAINPLLADAYAERGAAELLMGLHDQAEKDLIKSYELNPSSLKVLGHLDFYYLFTNQYDKAYRYSQERLILEPKEVFNYISLARIYGRIGMEKEAYDLLDEAKSKFGENKSIMYRTAWLDLDFKNDASGLIKLFREDVKNVQNNAFHKKQLAMLYVQNGEYKKAEKQLACYDGIPPCEDSDEFGKVLYAFTLKKLNMYEKSEKLIDDILQRKSKFLQPESSKYQYNFRTLAGAHAMKGNADSTIYWLQKWKDNYGNFSLKAYDKMPLFVPIWETPIGKQFIQIEQAKIDSMAANVRPMRIKG